MAESDTNLQGAALLVELDRTSSTPAHVQLEGALRDAIRSGRLLGDAVLPATRRLADELGLSRGVVVEAYQQLTSEGYLIAQTGGYTRVARGLATRADAGARTRSRRTSSAGPTAAPPSTSATGAPTSRSSRARHGCARCAPCSPKPRTTCSATSTAAGPPSCAPPSPSTSTACAAPGRHPRTSSRAAASPRRRRCCSRCWSSAGCGGWPSRTRATPMRARRPSARDSRSSASRSPRPGSTSTRSPHPGAEAVLVTPAHQFPTGGVLSPERRAALLDWARDRNALIIEDDYDAEHRYDNSPVGALHGLAPDQRRLRRDHEQDARARPAPRVDDRARRDRRAARSAQARRSTAARRSSSSWRSPSS